MGEHASEAVTAYVLLVVSIGTEHEVCRRVSELGDDAVTDCKVVYGEYDAVVRIEARSLKEIDRIVTRIRSMPEVVKTITLIAA